MATYRVTSPDGASFEITAPEGATPEQVQAFAQQQFAGMKAGPVGNAKAGGVLGGIAQGLRDPIDAGAQILRRVVPDAVGEAIDSAGNWLADRGLPVARSSGVQGVDRIVQGVGQQYEADRAAAGREGLDVARLAGNVANPVNRVLPGSGKLAAARTLPQLAKAGAMVGASSAALQPVVNNPADFWGEKAMQAGTGAVAGAVLTPAIARGGEAALKAAQGAMSRPAGPIVVGGLNRSDLDATVSRVLASQGMRMEDAPPVILESIRSQVTEALRGGKVLSPAAALRRAQAEALGLTDDAALTAGQLTREPMQFAQERNLSGVVINTPTGPGNPLATRFANQNQRLAQVFDDANAATDRVTAGETMLGALGEANKRADANVRAAYDAFRNATGRDLELPLQGLAQDYAATLDTFGDAIPGAVRRQFEGLGLMGGTQRRLMTIDDAENLIKTINANTDPANKPAFRALGQLRAAVEKAISDGADSAATGEGAQAAQLAKEARATAAEVFRTRREIPALQAALNDVAPDRFVQTFIINAPTREAEGLANVLRESPQAMQQARAQVLQYLRKAAFGENLAGDATFAADRYARALDAIGPQKLAVFFSPEEAVRLNLAGKLAAEINKVPAGATNAVNYSNTGAAVFNLFQRLGEAPVLRNIPGVRGLSDQAREIAQERAITSALQPQPTATTPAPELSPEARRALARLFAPSAVAGGSLAGSGR